MFVLYTGDLIFSTESITATLLSRMLNDDVSHDQITRFLSKQFLNRKGYSQLLNIEYRLNAVMVL